MLKVIVAEDERSIITLVTFILSQQGYHVTAVQNGKDAIEHLEREDFGLLIADIKMPVMNGLQLVEWAKQHYPAMGIIVISAHPDDALEAVRLGADDYVIKPFSRQRLLSLVEKHAGVQADSENARELH